MQTSATVFHAPRVAGVPPLWWADLEGEAPPPSYPAGRSGRADRDFIALLNAFRATGGLVRGETLADQMQLRGMGGYAALARLIANGSVMSFAWQHEYWLPAFQFDATLAVREASRRVVQELTGAFDGWTCAHWLVTPHAALASQTPLQVLDSDAATVLQAARADRFRELAAPSGSALR